MKLIYKNVSKFYEQKLALRDFSAEISSGEIVALLGPNGSGKTTLLNITAGILKPSSGDVIIGDYSILSEPIEAKRLLGFVPEDPFVYDMLSGFENIRFVCDLWDIDISKKEEEVIRLAQILEISKDIDNLVSTYSAGMKRKLAIIMALIHDPKVLVIDEITANLDPKSLASLELILSGIKKEGVAILFSTHILEIAEALADRVIIIKDGSIVWEGNAKVFREEATSEGRLKDLFFELTGGPEYEMIMSFLRMRKGSV